MQVEDKEIQADHLREKYSPMEDTQIDAPPSKVPRVLYSVQRK